MKKTARLVLLSTLMLMPFAMQGQEQVPQWGRFEKAITYHTEQNPFTDIELGATFVREGSTDTIRVEGFYDGNDQFKVRFMPTKTGRWKYVTTSPTPQLNGIKGSLVCTQAAKGDHGMVSADNDHGFRYADGTRYMPVGTTSYAWVYGLPSRRAETIKSLSDAGFNKIRFCVFPNNSVYDSSFGIVFDKKSGLEVPTVYPFKMLKDGKAHKGEYVWDYSRFNPEFFHQLEQCIDSLKNIGVEADLILFTPYDEGLWGFDRMPMSVCMRYLRYCVARLSSMSNLWWSVANEWDLVKARKYSDWVQMSQYISNADPYHHLLSIHGGTAKYFDYNMPCFTHESIQDQGPLYNFEGAATVRNIYPKPVIFDEVCYEGDHEQRWAQLTGQEMLQRVWTGLIGGTYVTHGECFTTGKDYYTGFSFLATGGKFQGTFPRRVKFTREILESLPQAPRLADNSWDDHTAGAGDGVYLIYFGDKTPKSWKFSLPAKNDKFRRLKGGEKFNVEIIDTWNMSRSKSKTTFEVKPAAAKRMVDKNNRSVSLPGKPYILLKITQAE